MHITHIIALFFPILLPSYIKIQYIYNKTNVPHNA